MNQAEVVLLIQMLDLGQAHNTLLLSTAELAVTVPDAYRAQRQRLDPRATQAGAHRLHEILRLIIRLGQESQFMGLSMSLVNDLAVRFAADRVSLGWVQSGYVRLMAVSHIEKFDRKSTASHEVELAMEEAYDQEREVAFPAEAGTRQVCRAHEHYVRQHGAGHVKSYPIKDGDTVVAVVFFERQEGHLNESEAWELGMIVQGVARHLHDLHQHERWFKPNWVGALQQWRDRLAGPGQASWKLAGGAALVVLAFLTLVPWTYHVDAGVSLRSKDLLFMPAPFDGYLSKVNVEVGDRVAAGAVLVELDTRDLALEEMMMVSEVARFSREAEKARASRQLAEMQISFARQQQSSARLQQISHQLAHAQVRAPRAGIVVEGELKKNLGSPVRKGDLLLKLAQTGETYVELEIDQVDVHEVKPGTRGEFALVGRPDQHFSLVVDRIDPAATQREGRNVYLARGRIDAAEQVWWRPGMGGNAKLDASDRSLMWIMTHRTIRFLRQVFWL